MADNEDLLEERDECEPSPGRWRYRLLAVIFMLVGLCFFAVLAVGLSYVVDQFWAGYTWEMGTMAALCGLVGIIFFAIGLRLFIRAPVSDAIRMDALRTACLWETAWRTQRTEDLRQ